jgi:Gpi18-like mannosyltransferase
MGLLLVPVFALMVIESRRLAIRFVWIYIVLGILVAISATFPLFLIARERRLAARGEATPDLGITPLDAAGLVTLGAAAGAFTFWTMVR